MKYCIEYEYDDYVEGEENEVFIYTRIDGNYVQSFHDDISEKEFNELENLLTVFKNAYPNLINDYDIAIMENCSMVTLYEPEAFIKQFNSFMNEKGHESVNLEE